MKSKSNQSKIDCLRSNHLCLDYSELDHSQLNHSMMVNASSIVLGGLMGLTLLSGIILSSSLASADDAVDVVTITVPPSCSMSSTGTNSHTAEIGNGQSNSTIGETTITTYCNDNEGFAIYAIGYTGDTLGNTVLTDTSLGSTHDIVTGTAASGNTSNWAMKLSTISSPAPNFPITIAGSTNDSLKEQGDPDYSTFQEVPDDYTKVAYRTSSTDVGTNAEGSVLKTTYQVYISPTQSAGTYTGQVKYVMVHPYMQDDSNKPTTSMTINDLTYMQDFATLTSAQKAEILASMTSEQQYQLQDSRDHKNYYISKLADGNVWMTQNLDHDIKNDGTVTYDNTTTDLGWNTSTNSYDTASWTPVAATHASNDMEWGEYNETDNPDGGDAYHAESYDPGNLYWDGDINTSFETSSTGNPHYYLGNYYNWTAAVAMNYSGDFNGVYDSETDDYLGATQSICPAGWTLPNTIKFDNLSSEYDFANTWSSPLYNIPNPELSSLGIGYWTSEDHSEANDYAFLYVFSSMFDTSVSGGREQSLFIRCVMHS